jgi:hypothetical protein
MKFKNNPDYEKLSFVNKIKVRYIAYKYMKNFKKEIKKTFGYMGNVKNIDIKFDLEIKKGGTL